MAKGSSSRTSRVEGVRRVLKKSAQNPDFRQIRNDCVRMAYVLDAFEESRMNAPKKVVPPTRPVSNAALRRYQYWLELQVALDEHFAKGPENEDELEPSQRKRT